MIRIITIEREYACGAAAIARDVAARLGWKLYDHSLTEQIATLAHCETSAVAAREERNDPIYYRLLKSFTLGSYEGSPLMPVESLDADRILRISEQVVLDAAASGCCVLVGRGSQHFLRTRSDALRFFLYAPRRAKLCRLLSEGRSESEARTLVDHIDAERASFIKRYFHVEWPDPTVYHAMFNTEMGNETVVQAIISLVNRTDLSMAGVSRAASKRVEGFLVGREEVQNGPYH